MILIGFAGARLRTKLRQSKESARKRIEYVQMRAEFVYKVCEHLKKVRGKC